MIFGTPVLCWLLKPVPHWPNSWPGSATPRPQLRCAINMLPKIVMLTLPGDCRRWQNLDGSGNPAPEGDSRGHDFLGVAFALKIEHRTLLIVVSPTRPRKADEAARAASQACHNQRWDRFAVMRPREPYDGS